MWCCSSDFTNEEIALVKLSTLSQITEQFHSRVFANSKDHEVTHYTIFLSQLNSQKRQDRGVKSRKGPLNQWSGLKDIPVSAKQNNQDF